MSDAFATLESTFDQAWQRILRGVSDRRAPARHPVLATVATDGRPAARLVVLRVADRAAGTLGVHTDLASAKVAEVLARPDAAFLIWDARAQLQIRLAARVRVLSGEDAAATWARIPEAARGNYGASPAPGTAMARPEDVRPGADPLRFAILACRIERLETLHLGRDRHRRAVFLRADGFAGHWVAP